MVFESVKNKLKRGKLVRLLIAVAVATATPAGCGFLAEADADELNAAQTGLVEVNKTVKDANNNVAVRATVAGIAAASEEQAAKAAAPAISATPQAFKLETGIPVPATARGGRKGDTYPFSAMEVGQSFFVASTPDRPTPAKSLASTVGSATQRFAEKTGEMETVKVRGKEKTREKLKLTRIFTVRPVTEGGVSGARVWRTQ